MPDTGEDWHTMHQRKEVVERLTALTSVTWHSQALQPLVHVAPQLAWLPQLTTVVHLDVSGVQRCCASTLLSKYS
jgi:hypothetical protein